MLPRHHPPIGHPRRLGRGWGVERHAGHRRPVPRATMDNHHRWDCTYPGVELLPDGRILSVTYGHWTEGESPWIARCIFARAKCSNDLGADQSIKDRTVPKHPARGASR